MSSKRTAAAALASGAALLLATGGAALAAHADARRADGCQERLARIAETRGVTSTSSGQPSGHAEPPAWTRR